MLIPLHLIPVPSDEPAGFAEPGHAARVPNGLKLAPGWHLGDVRELGLGIATATGPVRTADLMRFGQLMADAGLPLQPTRMLYDRSYAYDRLAEGHASEHPSLSELALELFEAYQGAGEWIGLVH